MSNYEDHHMKPPAEKVQWRIPAEDGPNRLFGLDADIDQVKSRFAHTGEYQKGCAYRVIAALDTKDKEIEELKIRAIAWENHAHNQERLTDLFKSENKQLIRGKTLLSYALTGMGILLVAVAWSIK